MNENRPSSGQVPRFRLWLLAIVVFAAAVRLFGLNWDQTHHFHPDERAIASAVMRIDLHPTDPQLDPEFFAYGSLPFYVMRAVTTVGSVVWKPLANYDNTILTGRAVNAVVGTLTVLLLILLGRRLYNPAVGLLAGFLLAACVLHVQNSHYATTDVFLTGMVLLALAAMLHTAERGRLRDFAATGALVGLAVATKFSAMPLLAPFAVVVLVRLVRERRLRAVSGRAALAVLVGLVAFALGEPWAFATFHPVEIGRGIGAAFAALPEQGVGGAFDVLLDRIFHDPYVNSIREQGRMVRNAGLLPYTNQYVGTLKYWYEIEHIVLWGMAPALGLAAIWATLERIVGSVRERSVPHLVLLSYVVPYFLITGWFEVKFLRYLLPVYPIMILWAAAWLWQVGRRGRLGRVTLWGVPGVTFLALLAFMQIYTRPHTVVSASEWVYRHVPAGSTILSQHWDEGFPFGLPGGRSPSRYTIENLPYYEPDTPTKMRRIASALAEADYIALQTKRLYGAISQAHEKYRLTNNYFHLLFAGDLGYELVYDQASRPSLFGIEFPDEIADESFSVYDHPKVLIFQKKHDLNADEIHSAIMSGRPSQKLTRNDILLASAADAGELGGDPSEPIQNGMVALLCLALIVEILGLSLYAVLYRWLPVPGVYALGKIFGILVFAWVPWVLVSVGVASFTRGTLGLVFLAIVVWGISARRRWPVGSEPERSEAWPVEILFWGAFAFFLIVRAYNPEIYWGEKPMDFAFLNALDRTTQLPPPEPWFAGSTLHYSYFGHYVIAALGKLAHIDTGITYNLAIGLVGGLIAAAVFAAGCAIGDRWRVGVLAALFAVLLGNLSGLREFFSRSAVDFHYFWGTSRVIRDTINEYPLWTVLFADLHAHMLVMPFSASFVALALWWVRRDDPAAPELPAVRLLLLLALTLGAILVTNTWSMFTYVPFFPFLIVCTWMARRGVPVLRLLLMGLGVVLLVPLVEIERLLPGAAGVLSWWALPAVTYIRYALATLLIVGAAPTVVLPTLFLVGLAVLFYLPYWADWTAPEPNWGWEGDAFTNAYDYLTIFGLFAFILVPFLFAAWRRVLLRRRPHDGRPRLGLVRALVLAAIGLAAIACLLLTIPFAHLGTPGELGEFLADGTLRGPRFAYDLAPLSSVRWGVGLLAVFALGLALMRDLDPAKRRVAIVTSFAFFVTAGVDVLHVWDRMNTVFKFYLEAWFLFSVAGAAALCMIWGGLVQSRLLRHAWQLGLVVLVGMAAFTAGTATYGILQTHRVPTPRPTLDGTAYIELRDPHEAAAFEWLNREVGGIPVIAEAWGPSYQDYSRVSMNTGLPTVLGWEYHVHQRAHPWGPIRRRKADLERLYTSDRRQEVAGILERYHIALVFVGPVERRAYAGGNLQNFRNWDDLLTPVYRNRGVTIFGVNGQFTSLPVTTIEEVPQEAGGEVEVQSPAGAFRQPRGVAVDAAGFVYVADFGNHRIQKLDRELEVVATWGGEGSLPGQFKQPCALDIGPDQNLYVADTWNQRIQVFDREGEYLREWGGPYFGPRGIAVAPTGKVYLVDTGNHRVRRFGKEGAEELNWGGQGAAPGQFNEPNGIAVDGQGRVYVADNGNGRLQVFDASGKLLNAFAVPGWKREVYSEPKVDVSPNGVIWLTVPTQGVVRAYDADGSLRHELRGTPERPFAKPLGIAYAPLTHELYVTDLENRVLEVPLPLDLR